ncbi:MAG TPA: glycosyltransferase family 39 protein, partial [Chloroflexota bacterium]
ALIFDEAYYVNAARVILGLDVASGTPYADQPAGLDPNHEHPPLGKILIAGSMHVFGDDALGWRLPSVVAGMASIGLLYGTARAAGAERWLATLATGLFAFDNLALVHSRIGSLDMMLVAFMLLGAWCALRRWPLLAGAAFGLASLVKISGVYGLIAMVLVEVVRSAWAWRDGRTAWQAHLRAAVVLVVGCVPVFLAGLWLLDSHLSTYATPWAHLQYILQYGLSLTRPSGPLGQESYPWQWLLNEVQMTYLRTDQQVFANDQIVASQPLIFFRGAMNPFIIGAAPLGISFAVWRAWRHRDLLGLWVVAWVVATYLPFYPLSMLQHRVSYIFYFLPTVPAVAVGVAQFLRQGGLPRLVQWGFLGGVLLGFVAYFPFRAMV